MEKKDNIQRSLTNHQYATMLINICIIIFGLHTFISYWFLTKLLHLWGANPDEIITMDDIYFTISSVNYNVFLLAGSVYLLYLYYYVVSKVDLFELTPPTSFYKDLPS